MKRMLPWTVLALGVALLQAHGWAWWSELIAGAEPGELAEVARVRIAVPGLGALRVPWADWMAPWRGWGWAVALEALAIWSWPRGGWRRWIVGGTCSAVLLAGVLWRISDPAVRLVFAPPVAVATETPRIVEARKRADDLAAGVRVYLADWTLRTKRTDALERLQDDLAAARMELAALLAAQATRAERRQAGLDWRRLAGIAAQAAAVVMVQIGIILAAIHLFGAGAGWRPATRAERREALRQRMRWRARALRGMEKPEPVPVVWPPDGDGPEPDEDAFVRAVEPIARPVPPVWPARPLTPPENGRPVAESVERMKESSERAAVRGPDFGPLADRIQAVRKAIEARFPHMTMQEIALAKAHGLGVSAVTLVRDLSLLANHELLVGRYGARTLNEPALERIERLAREPVD